MVEGLHSEGNIIGLEQEFQPWDHFPKKDLNKLLPHEDCTFKVKLCSSLLLPITFARSDFRMSTVDSITPANLRDGYVISPEDYDYDQRTEKRNAYLYSREIDCQKYPWIITPYAAFNRMQELGWKFDNPQDNFNNLEIGQRQLLEDLRMEFIFPGNLRYTARLHPDKSIVVFGHFYPTQSGPLAYIDPRTQKNSAFMSEGVSPYIPGSRDYLRSIKARFYLNRGINSHDLDSDILNQSNLQDLDPNSMDPADILEKALTYLRTGVDRIQAESTNLKTERDNLLRQLRAKEVEVSGFILEAQKIKEELERTKKESARLVKENSKLRKENSNRASSSGEPFFKALGIDPEVYRALPATAQRVLLDAIYRASAKIHHPDVGGDVVKMRQVNEAYETLRKRLPN